MLAQRDTKGKFIKGSQIRQKYPFDESKILELYQKGLTLKQISLRMGYSDINSRITRFIKSKGISRQGGFYFGHHYTREQSGEKNSRWNGGQQIDGSGYRRILRNGKYVLEHHINWCIANKIPIVPQGCVIHHKNQNKLDNSPENLVMLTVDLHTKIHWELKKGMVI